MDVFTLGRLMGEMGRDIDALKRKQKSMAADLKLLKRVVLLVALWSTGANGLSNSDQISSLLAAAAEKLFKSYIGL